MIRLMVGWSFYEIALNLLLQAEAVSDSLFRIAEQFPTLAAVMVFAYWMQKTQREDVAIRRQHQLEDAKMNRDEKKEDTQETRQWLEKMLVMQREILTETFEIVTETFRANQVFLSNLLTQIETKQNTMSEKIESLDGQIRMNTSTVGEIAKVDSMFSELIAMIGQRRPAD